ncbi:MAG: cytochrome c3 family protein, partial [Candidatus Eremiobacterota bacterium]
WKDMAPEEILVRRLQLGLLAALIVLPLTGWLVNTYNWQSKPQPIAFNHLLHAGNRQIACAYCHRGAENGVYAGAPSVQDCMFCHQNFNPATFSPYKQPAEGQPDPDQKWRDEVAKLKGYIDGKKGISWFKYYDMPEHVKFSHKAHINAGFDCVKCHGDVASMPVIKMQQKMTMGFCVTCHRDNHAPTDCTTCHR